MDPRILAHTHNHGWTKCCASCMYWDQPPMQHFPHPKYVSVPSGYPFKGWMCLRKPWTINLLVVPKCVNTLWLWLKKPEFQNGPLGSGNMDQNLRFAPPPPPCLMLSRTHVATTGPCVSFPHGRLMLILSATHANADAGNAISAG